jgi:NADH-quinone oxidoreductase subunit N
MHDLLPYLPGDISGVLESFKYFVPEINLAVLFIVVLLTDLIFGKNPFNLCRIIAFTGVLLVAFRGYQQIHLLLVNGEGNGHFFFNQMLLLTPAAIKFKIIIDVLAFVLIIYFEWDNALNAHSKGLADLYSIVIGSVFGLHLMVMAVNLLSVYVAIEMVSIASYLMVAYHSENKFGTEAGLKYVLFGAASSAMMLYGISLLYAFTGSLSLFSANFIPGLLLVNPVAVSFALVLVLAGIGFKLSFVPMQFWVPDVYEGAATPITAWLSTLPKIAAFALLINFLTPFIFFTKWKGFDFRLFFSVIGVITMIAGNFAAVLQNNVKRMLAYSSIGHTGFALMAIVTFTTNGISALTYYLAVYSIANIGALALASYFANVAGATDMVGYKGLGLKYPLASICFVIVLISLTGLPVTAGFTAKLFVFSAVYGVYAQNHNTWLLLLMVTGAVTTVVSLFYYIKIPLNLFLKRGDTTTKEGEGLRSLMVFSVIIAIAIVLLGVFPGVLFNSNI